MKKVLWPILGVVVMAILTSVQSAMADSHIDAQEWVQVGLGVLMAFNVWATANLPQYTSMKTYVAAAITVGAALYTFIVGGVSAAEWINLVILALSAVGVSLAPQPVTTVINGTTVPPTQASPSRAT
jgi:hypothetical protein